jgi:uncharacterized protein YdaU (DUF1376 family)
MATPFDKQWYPFYHDLFNRSTAGWNAERVGAYILLLNHQWQNNGIPKDEEELLFIAKCSIEILDKVLIKFEIEKSGRLFNKKMETIRKEQIAKYEKRANAGKQGGTAKYQNLSNAKAMVKQSDSNALPLKNKNKKENIINNNTNRDLDFQGLSEYRELWATWIEYKKGTFNFNYKSQKSEQIALNGFIKDTNSNHLYAKDVIEKAMAEQWKGLTFTEALVAKWKDRKPNEAAPVTIADQSKIPPHKDLRLLNYVQEQSKQELIAMYGENETELIIAAKTQQGTFYCDEQGEWQMQR